MKQGTAFRALTFSALAFSLLAGIAVHAQLIEVEPPSDETTNEQAVSVDGSAEETSAKALRNETPVTAQPVAVSPGMSPATVPAAQTTLPTQTLAQTQAQTQSQAQKSSAVNGGLVSPPNSSSMGGTPNSGTGNSGTVASSSLSNGSGTQINLNLPLSQQQNQQASQDQDQGLDQSRITELKMEKKIREKINEERMMERIEEDRIDGEKGRTKGIERFKFAPGAQASASASASSDLETAPVTAVGASSTAVAVATVEPEEHRSFFNDVRFKVVPVVGARWNQNRSTMFNSTAAFTGGVNLEGQVNRFFSIEGGFLYGHERMNYNGGWAYGGAGYGGVGYTGFSGAAYNMGAYNSYAYSYSNGYIYGPNNLAILAPRSRDSYEVNVGAKVGYQVSKVRPYLAAGVGGLFQKYHIDDQYTVAYLKEAGWTRSTDHFVANFGLGTDFDLVKNFSLGARFDYQAILNPGNGSYSMNRIWGDASNRFRLTGNLQIVF